MTARYLLSLAIIIGLSITLACNHGSNPIVPGGGTVKYISAAICSGCHKSTSAEWSATEHARALPGLEASGHASPACYVCHVVSLDDNPANSGFDDPDPVVAARFGGVQCEACHGAGGNHVKSFDPLITNLSGELCGGCHTDAHHPTYDEWAESTHAAALSNPQALPYFRTECLECHSADYIFADSVPDDATPMDFEYGITCVVCHDPHNQENEYQLRKDIVDLCAGCHNTEGAVPGEEVHHPNGDLYRGIGGYEYPGKDYENSAHTSNEDACASCHMWTAPFDALGTGEDAISGHTFEPRIEACRECHPDAVDFDIYGAHTQIEELLEELGAELDAATDADKLTLSYERALFNFEFVEADGTHGIHNFKYALALLTDALENFEPGL